MTITAKVLADSTSPGGSRLTSLELRYPRFIHAEVLTHRVFSRSASSSRAIPVERLIQDLLDDPVYPSFWGKNEPGMKAREEHNAPVYVSGFSTGLPREAGWKLARQNAIMVARAYADAGYHKQIVNRLLEPFAHINVIVTATDWANFFKLRRHADAQPEFKILADAIWIAMETSQSKQLTYGDWHTPYVSAGTLDKRTISAARCARVSYKTHEGKEPTWEADKALAKGLIDDKHLSPFEHQATPTTRPWEKSGNLVGWRQFRKEIE